MSRVSGFSIADFLGRPIENFGGFLVAEFVSVSPLERFSLLYCPGPVLFSKVRKACPSLSTDTPEIFDFCSQSFPSSCWVLASCGSAESELRMEAPTEYRDPLSRLDERSTSIESDII